MPRALIVGRIAVGLVAAIVVGAVVSIVAEPLISAIRDATIRITVPRAVIAGVALLVVVPAVRAALQRTGVRPPSGWIGAIDRARARLPAAARGDLPAAAALGAIVGGVLALRIEASQARTLPDILSDELIYGSLGRSIATGDGLLVRGVDSAGYGIAYPALISPAYALAADGVRAFEAVQVINATVMALAAVPAYLIARRALSPGMSLVAAGLAVVVPEMGYSAAVLTEALFYPAFLFFALALVRAIELPTLWRQLMCVGLLVGLVAIRAQAVVLIPVVAVAVPLAGASGRRWALSRAFLPTWLALALAALVTVIVTRGDPASALGAYRVLLSGGDVWDIPGWALKNLAALELGVGIIAFALLPVATLDLIRSPTAAGRRALGAVTLSTTLCLLASVAVLSASEYGLDRLHERNLFYVLPLIVICALTWRASVEMRRLRWPAIGGAVLAVALPVALTRADFATASGVGYDAPSLGRWDDLGSDLLSARWAVVLVAVVAAVVSLRMRSGWIVPVTVLIAFLSISTRIDHQSLLDRRDVRRLAWVDHNLPPDSRALLVYVGLPAYRCAPVAPTDSLSLWTEFFNLAVREVGHVSVDNPATGIASSSLTLSGDGRFLRDGRSIAGGFVVADSRLPMAGRRLATLRWTGAAGGIDAGPARLTLWDARTPLRLRQAVALERLRRSLACAQ